MSNALFITRSSDQIPSDKSAKLADCEIAFKVFDDIKKPSSRRFDNRFNMTSSTDNINKHHHYYHKNCFTSEGALNNYNPKMSRKEDNVSKEFFYSLDSKLRNLNADVSKGRDLREKRPVMNKSLENRPMFVTTVKTGVFLEPPPELAAILGLGSHGSSSVQGSSSSTGSNGEDVVMYSFASQPRVLNQKKRVVVRSKVVDKNINNTTNNNNSQHKSRQKRDLTSTPPRKT